VVATYGAVVDSGRHHPNGFGYLWVTNSVGGLQRIDTETGLKSGIFQTTGAYGITIDHMDRVWVPDDRPGNGAGSLSTPIMHRFDPNNAAFVASTPPCTACWSEFAASHCTGAYCANACGTTPDCAAFAGTVCSHGSCSTTASP
jgi:hypothetical protein